MPGRKRVPKVIREMQGNPGRRPIPQEPEFGVDAMYKAPAYLDEVAAKEYERMIRIFNPSKLMTDADITALAGYCAAYSTWLMAQKELMTHGLVIEAKDRLWQNPAFSISMRAQAEMRRWLLEFGMTPCSRSKVGKQEEKTNEADEFLNALEEE